MHHSLEDFLVEVSARLTALPPARRDDELKEMRQHLLNAMRANQEEGQSQSEALANALMEFGTSGEAAAHAVWAWRRENTWLRRLMASPPEVALFAVFAVTATVFQLWLGFVGPKLWQNTFYPIMGSSLPYIFCLYWVYGMIFAPQLSPKSREAVTSLFLYTSKSREIIISLLLFTSAMQFHIFLMERSWPNYHNPYLTLSPWQALWVTGIPVAWAIILGICPVIRKRSARQPVA
jgi:uncharacterized membrane protein